MFWLTACMFGGGKPQPGITGVDTSIEPEDPSDSGVDTDRSEVDLCDAIYLFGAQQLLLKRVYLAL